LAARPASVNRKPVLGESLFGTRDELSVAETAVTIATAIASQPFARNAERPRPAGRDRFVHDASSGLLVVLLVFLVMLALVLAPLLAPLALLPLRLARGLGRLGVALRPLRVVLDPVRVVPRPLDGMLAAAIGDARGVRGLRMSLRPLG